MFTHSVDHQLMELLKFDLYRKAGQERYYHVLFRTVARFKEGKLQYKSNIKKGKEAEIIEIEGMELLERLAQTISQFLPKMQEY